MPSAPATRGRPVAIGLVPAPAAGRAAGRAGRLAAGWPPPGARWDTTPGGPAPAAPNRSGAALGYSFAPPQRGVFQIGPAVARQASLLGLFTIEQVVSDSGQLLVAPALVEVDLPLPDPDSERLQLRSNASAERLTDPAVVRDYPPGAPRRRVLWRATARRDRLMVRDTVSRALPDAWVLVDDAAPPGAAAEDALAVAASVALALLASRHSVRLALLSGAAAPGRFDPGGSPDPLREAFARLTLAGERTASGKWVERLVAELGARGASGPLYGVLAHLDAALLADLRSAAGLAYPGVLWLVGAAAAGAGEVARVGWQMAQARP
jgi:uncharacterized protein (DUF58 family)